MYHPLHNTHKKGNMKKNSLFFPSFRCFFFYKKKIEKKNSLSISWIMWCKGNIPKKTKFEDEG